MVDRGSVLEVSLLQFNRTESITQYLPMLSSIVDLALTEAAYTIVRIVQRFPTIKLPEGEVVDLMGVEKQTMTLVMSITEGCKIKLL